MPKPLVVVESPAKAKTISRFLGGDFVVKASVGNIRDLPEMREGLGVRVDDHFECDWVVPPGKKQAVAELRRALRDASELYLATDEDREGESIAWHVLEVLSPKASVPVKRIGFHEITSAAVEAALEHPRQIDMRLVEAAAGRRVLDRLVGYEVSRVLWRRVSGASSAGRVQSVATRLVVERERERMAFRRASYWDLEGRFAATGVEFPAALVELDGRRLARGGDFDAATGRLAEGADVVVLDEAAATALAGRLREQPFSVASVESKRFTEHPKAPFITTTMQQEASRKLRFSSARTMSVAQRLYERGFITYHRTDSTSLSETAERAARALIRERYGDDYLPPAPRRYASKVKNAQEAHEAIRPAGDVFRAPEVVAADLDSDERALYELVWIRAVASQMVDARARRVTLRLTASSTEGEQAVFSASGKVYEFLGFRKAYVEGSDDDPAADGRSDEQELTLPSVSEGGAVECRDLGASPHETRPPARYTEATLIGELEKRGIGRPSTYAAIVDKITKDRGYLWKKGTALVPSWTGFAKVQLLERHFSHLVDYGFTAAMEEVLDEVANGRAEMEKWLHAFYFGNGTEGLRELVSETRLESIDARVVNRVALGPDLDAAGVTLRVGRFGPFLERGEDRASVPDDVAPDEFTLALVEELFARQARGPRVLGADPDTGKTVTVHDGRFGPYVQLGEIVEGSKTKPPRASLFASMDAETVTLDDALRLLSLPRLVGVDAEGNEITAQNGRYGPYVKKGTDSRSLESEDQIFSVTLQQAEAIFAQPKVRRGRGAPKPPLAELGPDPESGAPIRVLDGRYGPYVTDGTTNATVPRGADPSALTLDEAVGLLRERAARGPAKPRRAAKKPARKAAKKTQGARKATGAKKTVKKAAGAKKTVKKAAGVEKAAKGSGTKGTGPAAT
ncbi:MAG: type I DNA topoisomerase [Acidimicrobiia bacterium]|nr:type I DNA topoisomerase [Acidimicrobiia bacterium]